MMAKHLISGVRMPVIVILGATGAGKSKLALEIASKYNGEIISADSMQIYKKLDIITNKVTTAERQICPHYMIDCVSPLMSNYTVVNFRNAALPIIDEIHSRNRLPVIVGGTNYYIESLIWKLLVDIDVEENHGDTVLPPMECNGDNLGISRPPTEYHQRQGIYADDSSSVPPGECTVNQECLPPSEYIESDDADLSPGECEEKPVKRLKPNKSEQTRENLQRKTTDELYKLLLEVDEARGKNLHPNDRRKVLRSLEVYYREGCKMSDYLRHQHQQAGSEGGVSGPLRFPETCIIWVQAEQTVLDTRTDRRVDEMIEQGLIHEMTDFHTEYNEQRLRENREADYTTGIFQSIGFKEFHAYLIMSEEERETENGKAALAKGIEDMKRATRQYARKQHKWIINRFLKRRGSTVPSVYAVDSSDPSLWQTKVYEPASRIVKAVLKGIPPPENPMPFLENDNEPVYEKCEVCDVVLLTSQQWQNHLKGRRHKKNLEWRNRQRTASFNENSSNIADETVKVQT